MIAIKANFTRVERTPTDIHVYQSIEGKESVGISIKYYQVAVIQDQPMIVINISLELVDDIVGFINDKLNKDIKK